MWELSGYLGLFLAAFGAATLLPMQSEAVLLGLLLTDRYAAWALLAVATTGNVLGSALNWLLGRSIEHYRHKRWFPVSEDKLEQAMYRELFEEVGLKPEHVRIIGRTRGWLRYDVPKHWIKREWRNTYRGQKQIWFLLRLVGRDSDVCLRASNHPEFDAWRWSYYWVPLEAVIEFKRGVYQSALLELSRLLFRNILFEVPASYLPPGGADGHSEAPPS